MTPAGSIKNYTFGIGDSEAGPLVQLGLVTSLAEEPLDWRHVVDPPHFHGSDQFRVLAGGEWNVGGKPLYTGEFMFQEAGKVYREHPASDDPAWIVLVIGDRRGALPTIMAEADKADVDRRWCELPRGRRRELRASGWTEGHPRRRDQRRRLLARLSAGLGGRTR